MTPSARIRMIRKTLSMGQHDFALRVGLRQNNVSQLEHGTVDLNDKVIKRICRVFDISEDWLRNEEGTMFNNPDAVAAIAMAHRRGKYTGEEVLNEPQTILEVEQRAAERIQIAWQTYRHDLRIKRNQLERTLQRINEEADEQRVLLGVSENQLEDTTPVAI